MLIYENNIEKLNIILLKRFNLIKILNIIIIIKKRYSFNNILRYRECREYVIIIIRIINIIKLEDVYNQLNII